MRSGSQKVVALRIHRIHQSYASLAPLFFVGHVSTVVHASTGAVRATPQADWLYKVLLHYFKRNCDTVVLPGTSMSCRAAAQFREIDVDSEKKWFPDVIAGGRNWHLSGTPSWSKLYLEIIRQWHEEHRHVSPYAAPRTPLRDSLGQPALPFVSSSFSSSSSSSFSSSVSTLSSDTGLRSATRDQAPSLSLMYRMIAEDFWFVKRPLSKDWGLCGTCEKHKACARNGFRSDDARLAAIEDHRLHVVLHRAERLNFVQRVAECRHDPRLFNLLHYDYTRCIYVPDARPKPSPLRRLTPVPIHVGACMSMATSQSFIFTHYSAFPKDGNIICTILYHTTRAILASGGVSAATRFMQFQCDGGQKM